MAKPGFSYFAPAIKRLRKAALRKMPDCMKEKEGNAEASVAGGDKAAGLLNKRFLKCLVDEEIIPSETLLTVKLARSL